MPENEKPKLSGELLHQLLGEYVEKAGQALRRHERIKFRWWGGLALLSFSILGLSSILVPGPVWSSAIKLVGMATTGIFGGYWLMTNKLDLDVAKEDLALSFWQLRRIYELASRYEDTGLDLEPALRTGIVLKLGEAQLLLRQLQPFESKDARFEEMRSLGPDPLWIQPQAERQPPEEPPPGIASGLATTER